MKHRLWKVLRLLGLLALGGLLYAAICRRLGFGIPCIFHSLTGLQCPGCGISRMCLALLRLDLKGAWEANCAVLCLLPVGLWVAVSTVIRYVRTGNKQPGKWENRAIWLMIAVLLIFGVVRNLI